MIFLGFFYIYNIHTISLQIKVIHVHDIRTEYEQFNLDIHIPQRNKRSLKLILIFIDNINKLVRHPCAQFLTGTNRPSTSWWSLKLFIDDVKGDSVSIYGTVVFFLLGRKDLWDLRQEISTNISLLLDEKLYQSLLTVLSFTIIRKYAVTFVSYRK